MNVLIRFLCCLVLVNLTACATYERIMSKKNPEIKQCLLVCVKHLEYCKQHCTDNCRTCSAKASYTSAVDYMEYVRQVQVQGGFITRGLNSFRDPLQCRKVSCNCTADFIVCKQGCNGVIPKKLSHIPYCT